MAVQAAHGAGARLARTTTSKPVPQYWVVNNSPPGTGPGGAAFTSYAIVRGSFDQAASIPNAGGVSGPYASLPQAYAVWRREPQNQDVSTLTKIEQTIGSGIGFAVYGSSNPGAVVQTGQSVSSTNWLGGLGGILASGLEAGLIQFLKDLWTVVEGPVLIILGALIIFISLAVYFREGIASVAGIAARAAAL